MHDGVFIDLWGFGVPIHEYGEEILMKKIHREKTETEKINNKMSVLSWG